MDFFIIESFGNQKQIEKLDCSHEEHNPFDWFVIKTVTGDGIIVLKKDQRKRGEVPKKKQTDIKAMLGVTVQVSSSKKQQYGVEVIEIA